MRVPVSAFLALPALLALAACGSPPPQTTQIIVQPQPRMETADVAPVPPPPPHSELVPPPPTGSQPMVWQPGHWQYTGAAGNPWFWADGKYVAVPPGSTTWVPGSWQQQSGGSWLWVQGHWA
jgi:hypothetical protein